MFQKIAIWSLVGIFLVGCAHHNDVRPGLDGIHRIALRTDNTSRASRNAMKQANHFCKERNQFAAVVEENSKYSGSMKEEDYNQAKTMANVAKGVGGAAVLLGGKNEKKAGVLVGVGGGIADSAIGNGYTVEIKFRCL